MEIYQAILLGFVQGFTEFLPISSSGHLVIFSQVLGWSDQGLLFDVVLHMGSLLALITYFRQDIWQLIVGTVVRPDPAMRKLALTLVVATIPVVIGGLLLQSGVEDVFRSVGWIGLFSLIVGILFVLSRRLSVVKKDLPPRLMSALWVGLAQVLALLPGVSRSGMTTWAGTRIGLTHVDAARFSFLLGIPTVFGAGLKVWLDLPAGESAELLSAPLLWGFSSALVASYLSIHWLLRFFQRHTLVPFGVYLIGLGIVALIWTAVWGG